VNFENEELRLNGELVTFTAPAVAPTPDSILTRLYGGAPRVTELRAGGRTAREAVDQYLAEVQGLFGRATAAYVVRGFSTALAELQASPLVQVVETDELNKAIVVERRGMRGRDLLSFTEPWMLPSTRRTLPENKETKSRHLLGDITAHIDTAAQGLLILVTRTGNVTYLGGDERARALVQIGHVLSGQPMSTLPAGPLRANSWTLKEIAAAAGRE
jgi:hypothetical protein